MLFWSMILAPILSQGQGTGTLLENSPFLPPAKANGGNADEAGGASLALLQLRGITSIEGEYIFSIYNPSTKQSKWIKQGVEEEGMTIRSYNPVGNTVMIHSESEDDYFQLRLNEYAQPTPGSAPKATITQPTTATRATSGGTTSRENRTVDTNRPSRRNLEILRERREALANQLRQQSNSGSTPANSSQGRGTDRPSNPSRR